MHLIKSALLLILFACLPFSASAAPVAVAKNPLAATTPATTVSPGEQVNINTVDEAALIRGLNGVGEAKAGAILEYRAAHGPFVSVDQLLEVKGVGPALLEKNRARIVIE
ncbi:ComEA family DNA-binding protein [Pseudomonas aeruginosa]|uniref:ComEA family DNA-binding protein n=1 Tax=Pseudomonas aeruginosa TaxID=287 RepID=UPI00053DE75F|nr:ComEA family DNA-binding protein [Pseudomonas aeruginosa]